MSDKLKKRDLLKMIQDLQDEVGRLRTELNLLRQSRPPDPIYIPSVWTVDTCLDGKEHDYPNPWFGTVPPSCRKCGKLGQSFTITCSTQNDDESGLRFYKSPDAV